MWATIHSLVRKSPRLRLMIVALLSMGVVGLVQTDTTLAADGSWTSATSVKVGNSEFFNPKKDGNGPKWFVEESKYDEGKGCETKIFFDGDPTQNTAESKAHAAKGVLTTYRGVVDENGDTFICNPDDTTNITLSGAPSAPTTPPPGTGTATPTPQCDVGGLSFIVCPLINFMSTTTKAVSGILSSLLYVQPLSLDTGNPKNTLFRAWSSILTVANVVLAIAFLFVIFAQATAVGLSNYGIKKMLPRIIAAAILMNLSYYICAIAVDLSNLAGVGVTGLLGAVLDGFTGQPFSEDTISKTIGNSSFMEGLAGFGVIAIIAFFFLVPVLLSALAVLFTLAARLAIIVLLVMIAPLAFAAWILPNTEKYFRKWCDLFVAMLVLYPMVMAVFAGSTVASSIIAGTTIASAPIVEEQRVAINPPVVEKQTTVRLAGMTTTNLLETEGKNAVRLAVATTSTPVVERQPTVLLAGTPTTSLPEVEGKSPEAVNAVLMPMIALIVQALPLFLLPLLFKTASGFLGRINAMSQSIAHDRLGGKQLGDLATGTRKRAMQNAGAAMHGMEGKGKLARAGRFVGGYKARRDFKHNSQKANADYIHQKAVAGKVIEDEDFARQAAGAGGTQGMNRAKGMAAATLSKAMGEAVDSEIKTLEYEALRDGTTLKKYSGNIAKIAVDEARRGVAPGQRTYSASVVEAAMEAQAREGNMNLFEEARGVAENTAGISRENQMQSIVDRVISRNVGTFKGKGGFHLQDDFNLRRDGMVQQIDPATGKGMVNADNTPKMVARFTSDAAWQDALTAAKVGSLGNTDALNMNSLKHGWLSEFSSEIARDPDRVIRVSTQEDLQKTYNNVYEALTNDTARASIGDRLPQVEAIEQALRARGFSPSQKPPQAGGGGQQPPAAPPNNPPAGGGQPGGGAAPQGGGSPGGGQPGGGQPAPSPNNPVGGNPGVVNLAGYQQQGAAGLYVPPNYQPPQQGGAAPQGGVAPVGPFPGPPPPPPAPPRFGNTSTFTGGTGSIPTAPQGTYQGELRVGNSDEGSYIDDQGRPTPNGASDDYHDKISK